MEVCLRIIVQVVPPRSNRTLQVPLIQLKHMLSSLRLGSSSLGQALFRDRHLRDPLLLRMSLLDGALLGRDLSRGSIHRVLHIYSD